jgi:hypothetical protein
MKKNLAEEEQSKHANLRGKVLEHKKYKAKMQVVDIGVEETPHKSNDYYVYCKLKGKLGDVTETLDYVLKNYSADADNFNRMEIKPRP